MDTKPLQHERKRSFPSGRTDFKTLRKEDRKSQLFAHLLRFLKSRYFKQVEHVYHRRKEAMTSWNNVFLVTSHFPFELSQQNHLGMKESYFTSKTVSHALNLPSSRKRTHSLTHELWEKSGDPLSLFLNVWRKWKCFLSSHFIALRLNCKCSGRL